MEDDKRILQEWERERYHYQCWAVVALLACGAMTCYAIGAIALIIWVHW